MEIVFKTKAKVALAALAAILKLNKALTMILHHYDLKIEFDDTWWAEAEMDGFVPHNRAYRVDRGATNGTELFEIQIDEVAPVIRNPGIAYFVKKRALEILNGFRNDEEIPPVEIAFEPPGSKFRYRLLDGCHRFYCSLAAGFSHVPAVEGFDINTLDQ